MGMEEDKTMRIEEAIREEKMPGETVTGRNVYRRLKLYYGP